MVWACDQEKQKKLEKSIRSIMELNIESNRGWGRPKEEMVRLCERRFR